MKTTIKTTWETKYLLSLRQEHKVVLGWDIRSYYQKKHPVRFYMLKNKGTWLWDHHKQRSYYRSVTKFGKLRKP